MGSEMCIRDSFEGNKCRKQPATNCTSSATRSSPSERELITRPSGSIFHARYLHSRNSATGATKVGLGNISPRAFPYTHRSVLAPSWLSTNRASKNRPRRVRYAPSCTVRYSCTLTLGCIISDVGLAAVLQSRHVGPDSTHVPSLSDSPRKRGKQERVLETESNQGKTHTHTGTDTRAQRTQNV